MHKDAYPLPKIDNTLHTGWCTLVHHTGPGKRLLTSGDGSPRSQEDGILHPGWPLCIQCYAVRALQCTCNVPMLDGLSPYGPAVEHLPSLLG